MAQVPAEVKSFLQQLPNRWDDVQFIEGFPGKYVVIARKAGGNGISPASMEKIHPASCSSISPLSKHEKQP